MANGNINLDINVHTKQAIAGISALNNSIKGLDSTLMKTKGLASATGSSFSGMFKGIIASQAVFAVLGGIQQGMSATVNTLIDFDSALKDIEKTTGLTTPEVEMIGDRILELGRTLPVTTNELTKIASIVGQLGINAPDEILQLTEAIGKLTLATDLTAEAAAFALPKILQLTGEPIANIDQLASSLVNLGNNSKATEGDIVGLAKEVSKSASLVNKFSSVDVLALSAALKELGSESEVSGSAMIRVFADIEKELSNGGRKAQLFAQLTGKSVKELSRIFKEDAFNAFQLLIKGMNSTIDSGEAGSKILKELGFNQVRLTKVIGPLASRFDVLREKVSLANINLEEYDFLQAEVETRAKSLQSGITILKNEFDFLVNSQRSSLIPTLQETVQIVKESLPAFVDLASTMIKLTSIVIKAGAGIGQFGDYLIKSIGYTSPVELANKKLRASLSDLDAQYRNGAIDREEYLNTQKKLKEETEKLIEVLDYPDVLEKNLEAVNNLNNVTKEEIALTKEMSKEGFTLASIMDTLSHRRKMVVANQQKLLLKLKEENLLTDENKSKVEALIRANVKYAEIKSKIASGDLSLNGEQELNALKEKQTRELDLNAEHNAKLKQQELTHKADMDVLALERELVQSENKFADRESEIEQLAQFERQKTFITLESELARAKLLGDSRKQVLATKKAESKAELAALKIDLKEKQALDQLERESMHKNIMAIGDFSRQAQAITKKGSEINKGFMISESLVNTYASATRAMREYPFPANIAVSAATVAAGLASVNKIRQQSFAAGGIVQGPSTVGDQVQVRANAGEMILNKAQQSSLFNNISNGSINSANEGGVIEAINALGNRIASMEIVVQANDEAIARSASRGFNNGVVIGENI